MSLNKEKEERIVQELKTRLPTCETEEEIQMVLNEIALQFSRTPFNDANKRTALIAMRLFLKLNGYDLAASPEDKYTTIIRVAASDISEDELAQWIRKNLEKVKS